MTDLRKGFDETGLHLRRWHGAGAAAQALIEAKKLKAHYGPDIAASNITPQQDAAHHAYFGGRIELLKQGYIENVVLHCYDIASAYPAGMVDLPSLAGGKWINLPGSDILTGSLAKLRKAIEATSPVSMFKIGFQFPTYEKSHGDARKSVFIPFYPLPYREKRGGILFPASGYGWYMRDHVLGAIAWLEHSFPTCRDRRINWLKTLLSKLRKPGFLSRLPKGAPMSGHSILSLVDSKSEGESRVKASGPEITIFAKRR